MAVLSLCIKRLTTSNTKHVLWPALTTMVTRSDSKMALALVLDWTIVFCLQDLHLGGDSQPSGCRSAIASIGWCLPPLDFHSPPCSPPVSPSPPLLYPRVGPTQRCPPPPQALWQPTNLRSVASAPLAPTITRPEPISNLHTSYG